ncbi:RWD domain-domain-containing protein, partial [Coniella lustricola]
MDSEDQRDVELLTLSAIYPELQRVSEDDPYTFTLDLPVNPSKTVTVYFPASTGQAPTLNPLQTAPGPADGPLRIDSHQLSYLPALHLQISLPSSYPTVQPPDVHVSTRPSWLPTETAKRLESECARLWEELGRDLVIFSYVDHVQQLADDVFGLVSDKGALEISPEYKISILDHDIGAKRAAFEKQTFDCGVCLDPKKGSKCHQMLDCGHVFCAACLQDFYNNAITEGDITAVRCLEPNCAKEREDASAKSGKKSKTSKVIISPSELLQIPIELDMVRRFVSVKYKTKLESDKNTIYCPRSWCQGAAKSKKHKKPQGLEIADDDSDEEDETGTTSAVSKIYQSEDRLAVCEDCGFAFCSRCLLSWHGEFVLCSKPRNAEEISEEDKASLDFINLHTTPCPTCDSRAQKTFGCNHMQCFRCQTHFCYLCSAWLDPKNPYQHYNEHNGTKTTCYMRLWDLENGDED